GDRYFYIPALGRHRGVTHFYLENYNSGDYPQDYALAKSVGEAAIDTYCQILRNALETRTTPTEDDFQKQLAYHTLYLFQVLTLDRGTTSGLLIHNQNDVGIMGSLPSHVSRNLLASWKENMPAPQDQLLQSLVDALPVGDRVPVEDAVKQALADAVRSHYQKHPEAIDMQATGNSVPTTVDNHK
ncbi:MAG: coproporphyrinogen III oxidase, partial [Gammaproteobacteria bacterium]|nr:coproporphyrinogen III oxidase [Gammaproteobacteria bacterium]